MWNLLPGDQLTNSFGLFILSTWSCYEWHLRCLQMESMLHKTKSKTFLPARCFICCNQFRHLNDYKFGLIVQPWNYLWCLVSKTSQIQTSSTIQIQFLSIALIMVYCLFYVTSKVIFFVFHVYFSPIITSLNLSWSCLHLFFSFKNEMREKNEFNHFPAVFLVCCSSRQAAENIIESLKTTKPFYVIINNCTAWFMYFQLNAFMPEYE